LIPLFTVTFVWVDSIFTNTQRQEVLNGEAHFVFEAPGTYTFYAYNEASDGRIKFNRISASGCGL